MKTQRILQLITAVAIVAALAVSPATASAAAPAQTYTRPDVVTLARPFTPTVDGNLSEWGSLPNAINQVVYGSQNWTGRHGPTANARLEHRHAPAHQPHHVGRAAARQLSLPIRRQPTVEDAPERVFYL